MSQYDRKANNSTNYIHPNESNLWEVHKAMEYNGLGQPTLRTQPNPTSVDAFGRLRTSNPYTIFDSSFRYGTNSLDWDTATAGSGSTTHLLNESTVAMDVTTANGDSVIRETKRVFLYQPGKSQLNINTFVFSPGKTGLRQRVGLFTANNGIFVERDGETTYIVKRGYTTGSAVDTRIAQDDWNGDTLDGNGYSTVNLDWDNVQIMWCDIEWLGAGTVRVGFVVDGQFILAHSFHHANTIQSVYMTTATLPLRCEITNTAETASNSRLKHICNTVISEGGYTPRAAPRAVSTPLTGRNLSNTGYTPVIALRLKSTQTDGIAIPVDADFYGLQNAAYRFEIITNVTLTGGTWLSVDAESHVEYNLTATGFTGGRSLIEGIFVGGAYGGATNINFQQTNGSLQLRRRIDNTPEVLLIAVQATTNNDDAVVSVAWAEHN